MNASFYQFLPKMPHRNIQNINNFTYPLPPKHPVDVKQGTLDNVNGP